MLFHRRVAAAMALAGAFATGVEAQAPPSAAGQVPARANPVPGPRRIAPTQAPSYRRSVVHHNPYPYPNYYQNDETAGFHNPGGVGRYREYYPLGDKFQIDGARDPVQVARFDQGGGAPDRAEQLQAESLGIAKYNSIQGHIDNYARPSF